MSTPKDVNREFQRLFFAARRELAGARTNAGARCSSAEKVRELAAEHGIRGAESLLQANSLDLDGRPAEALELIGESRSSIDDSLTGISHFLRGSVLQELGNDELAISAYDEATKDPNFMYPATAWCNQAIIHAKAGQYDEALDLLWRAANQAEDPHRGTILFNLGQVYSRIGQQEKALECYRSAIQEPDFPPGDAWHNIGVILSLRGELTEAVEAFRNALKDPLLEMPGSVWGGIGWVEYLRGNKELARDAAQKALEFGAEDSDLWLKIRNLQDLIESKLQPDAFSEEDRVLVEARPNSALIDDEPEQRILLKLQLAKRSQYEAYLHKPSSNRDNILSILRGWSSAVTLLDGSERLWRGGGYLIKWRDIGIAVDPGFDFLRNLHDARYHGREIDVVIVSHNHPDHNADLTRFDDLRYELYKRRDADPVKGVIPYLIVWDADSRAHISFSTDSPEHQAKRIVFDVGRCEPVDTIRPPRELPFLLEYFEVRHGDLKNAVGFKLRLLSNSDTFTIGYTGDTEFFPELVDRLSGCDILIAHISQPDPKEFRDPTVRKTMHLGYRGMAELVRGTQPRLTLVGEFWAGLADLRIEMVQGLRRLAGTGAILPAGLGLHVLLPAMLILCSDCGHPVPSSEIRVAPPATPYGNLAYLCRRCLLG